MKEYKLPIGCDVPETIILADGDFPSHPLALEWLRQCPYVCLLYTSLSKSIGQLMKEGKKEDAETAKTRVAEIKETSKALQAEMDKAQEDLSLIHILRD